MSNIRSITARKNDRLIHVETPLGIVNIYLGLTGADGSRRERIEYLLNDYSGEPRVKMSNDTLALLAIEEVRNETNR